LFLNAHFERVVTKVVAGTGADLKLPSSQFEVVAGPGSNLNLQKQKGRLLGAADLRELVSQVEMVAGKRSQLYLLLRAAA
jgi:hypothetical protein